MSNKRLILTMGWVTLLIFPLIGLTVLALVNGKWQYVFQGGWALHYQMLLGLVTGVVIGYSLRALLATAQFKGVTHKYGRMLSEFSLQQNEYVFLSVCAGIGEEILFRGCIQEFAGIYITAVLFVALHGYLNPANGLVFLYGTLLTGIFIGVGFMMQYTGIYGCILMHIIIDVILFDFLHSTTKNEN